MNDSQTLTYQPVVENVIQISPMPPPTYVTENLPLACFIVANELLPFKSVERVNNLRLSFHFFDYSNTGKKVAADFWSGGIVSAVKYYDAMRRLRKLMEEARHD